MVSGMRAQREGELVTTKPTGGAFTKTRQRRTSRS
jgi:hypothetical protein